MTLDYPWYFVLLCLIAGMGYSALLYHRTTSFTFPLRVLLAAFRFVAVSLLAFLLLSPIVHLVRQEKERPVVVVAYDDSRSVILCRDSTRYREQMNHTLQRLASQLDKRYDVQLYRYSGKAEPVGQPQFNGDGVATDLSSLFHEVYSRYGQENLADVVLFSDGIWNCGQHPFAVTRRLLTPIHCVLMGDTAVRRDAAITHVRYNRRVAVGNRFPVEVTMHITRMRNSSVQCVLAAQQSGATGSGVTRAADRQAGRIAVESDDFLHTETFWVEAKHEGLYQYTLRIDNDRYDDDNPLNNVRTITIEVVDMHHKVLILTSAAHPDIAALRAVLEGRSDCEVTVRTVQPAALGGSANATLKREIDAADVVILHHLASAELYRDLQDKSKPVMHVVGVGADLAQFNAMHSGVAVHTGLSRYTDAVAVVRSDFVHFSLSDAQRSAIEQYPPLQSPFGDYKMSPHVQPLFYARIGDIVTEQPLVAVSAAAGRARQVWVMGDGLWRWRLADFRVNGSHQLFDEMVSQWFAFVSTQNDAGRFHIVSPTRFRQGDPVVVESELYDSEGKLTQQADVALSWKPEDGKTLSMPFTRSLTHRTFVANLGHLPAGSYRLHATAQYGDELLQTTGYLVVEDEDLEQTCLVADHALLRSIAYASGGVCVPFDSVDNLLPVLDNADAARTRVVSHSRYVEWLHRPWVLILLLMLLSAEWLLRKRNGHL